MLASIGCRSGAVVGLDADWSASPLTQDFGRVYLGAPAARTITVHNGSRAPVQLSLELAAPFEGPASVTVGGGDSIELPLRFAPDAIGEVSQVARLSDGAKVVEVALRGAAAAIPRCESHTPCREARFDLESQRCVEEPSPDGTACTSACLTDAACFQGECVGAARSCDDRNACTLDSCDPLQGCTHQDVSARCPASRGPCEAATCRPESGCGFAPAPDGTSCGPNDCSVAQVCIAGQCEERPAPDGSECAPAGLCQAAATCHQNVCTPGPLTSLRERWRYSNPGHRLFFEGTVEPDGTTYFTESSTTDPQASLDLVALDRTGREVMRVELERPCRGCSARLMLDPAGHRVFTGRSGRVQAWSTRTGAQLWTRDTTAGRVLRSPQPDGGGYFSSSAFIGLTPELVVEVLYEGYELHRQYFVAMERSTGLVAWERDWWGHVYNPGVTASNELWVAAADCWAPIQQSQILDTTGQTVATVVRPARPVAFGQSEALLTTGTDYVWASPRGIGAPLPVAPSGYPWGLTAPRRTMIASYSSAQEFDEDGGARWSRGFRNYVSTGVLLTDGGTLLTEYSNDGGSMLYELDARGTTVFGCPLPGTSNAGAPASGLYIANLSSGNQDSIVAFEVPGAELEPFGWTTPAGSPRNDHRVH